jgi:hypothetical protein
MCDAGTQSHSLHQIHNPSSLIEVEVLKEETDKCGVQFTSPSLVRPVNSLHSHLSSVH